MQIVHVELTKKQPQHRMSATVKAAEIKGLLGSIRHAQSSITPQKSNTLCYSSPLLSPCCSMRFKRHATRHSEVRSPACQTECSCQKRLQPTEQEHHRLRKELQQGKRKHGKIKQLSIFEVQSQRQILYRFQQTLLGKMTSPTDTLQKGSAMNKERSALLNMHSANSSYRSPIFNVHTQCTREGIGNDAVLGFTLAAWCTFCAIGTCSLKITKKAKTTG